MQKPRLGTSKKEKIGKGRDETWGSSVESGEAIVRPGTASKSEETLEKKGLLKKRKKQHKCLRDSNPEGL